MKMNGCHTDCLERPLSRGFYSLGKLVARYPWWFIIIPILISAGLGVGFCYLEKRQSNNLEDQFTPIGGPAKTERNFIRMHFPVNDSGQFSAPRLYTEGSFASLIVVNSSNNILNKSAFEELQKLDRAVKGLSVTLSESKFSFQQLCAQVDSSTCLPANPLLAFTLNKTGKIDITYPMFQNRTFLGRYLGGVKLGPANTVQTAQALRLVYYLREGNDQDRDNSLQWLNHFIKTIPEEIDKLQLKYIQVYYSTSISLQKEFEGNTKTVIPLFSITYFVTISFAIVSCMRLDSVRNKVWVATFGVLSAGLAILSSFGLLLFCRVPFVITVANAPFLILGVGVDDMFIMISCWQQTKVKSTLEERMADTYKEAAVSITITTLTDVLAFYIGIMTPFPSVQSFCIYTGTTLVFCYIYCITFFGAVLALNGKRENDNRHWLICTKVKSIEKPEHCTAYNACCVGGSFDTLSGTETEHPMNIFFYKYYGPFITKPLTKLLVLVLYLAYLVSSIYGCVQIKEGIDVRNLANDDSYLNQYYNEEELYFSEYGPRVMVIATNKTDYWELKTHAEIENCMQKLESNRYVKKEYSVSWLRTYEMISKASNINITNKDNFMKNVSIIYKHFSHLRQDIEGNESEIKASRFFIQTVNLTTAVDEKNMLRQLREIAANCNIPLMVYHPTFIYFDQYVVIIQNTIQNLIVATVVMLVISLLLIPNPLCSLWVTFAIVSIIVGVTGFMTYWKVNLDSISMINLIICIGFSVDFSAHIAYAYVSNKKPNANERVIDALRSLGYPIFQGALSTILGIVALSVAASYIFRTFFKIMFFVIVFGALHGLVFIPVFLTMLGAPLLQGSSKVKNPKIKERNTNTLKATVLFRGNPVCYENQIRIMDPVPYVTNIETVCKKCGYRAWQISWVSVFPAEEQSLPGYADTIPNVINTQTVCRNCSYRSCQSSVVSVFPPVDELGNNSDHKNKSMEYRRRMMQLYLEGKIDPDCP
ncbi:patched domain-containing protein 3-like [Ascaphus truei]|uniref:patched domain-containing protein 3-like n=1 Tax=Ascaphus truei TaxID=8439 RepID=UPI003F5A302B